MTKGGCSTEETQCSALQQGQNPTSPFNSAMESVHCSCGQQRPNTQRAAGAPADFCLLRLLGAAEASCSLGTMSFRCTVALRPPTLTVIWSPDVRTTCSPKLHVLFEVLVAGGIKNAVSQPGRTCTQSAWLEAPSQGPRSSEATLCAVWEDGWLLESNPGVAAWTLHAAQASQTAPTLVGEGCSWTVWLKCCRL